MAYFGSISTESLDIGTKANESLRKQKKTQNLLTLLFTSKVVPNLMRYRLFIDTVLMFFLGQLTKCIVLSFSYKQEDLGFYPPLLFCFAIFFLSKHKLLSYFFATIGFTSYEIFLFLTVNEETFISLYPHFEFICVPFSLLFFIVLAAITFIVLFCSSWLLRKMHKKAA